MRGFSLIEVLIAGVLIVIVAMAGALYLVRRTQRTDAVRERVFANQKALSILAELRAFVAGAQGILAAGLDRFDDGAGGHPSLTIQAPEDDAEGVLAPDHPISGNVMEAGTWRWLRQIRVRPFGPVEANDRRLCAVRIYRLRPGEEEPGTLVAEAASLIQSATESPPMTQVYDLYVLALENVPGWALAADQRLWQLQAALTDLEARNPGLVLRVHWITKLGYGRDAEYAPYVNEERSSTDPTPWAYVYPGRLPDGAAGIEERYYDGPQMQARLNLDGETTPAFHNTAGPPEVFTDGNGNGVYDAGELFTDANANGRWDAGNPLPYALADGHNHCVRGPEAEALFAARVHAGVEDPEAPTWRLLLDRMVAQPERYHNALILNLHGSLLPMPPVRNVSDPCKDPIGFPGWRAVTHPERLHARRVAGNDALSTAPVFRVHAWKTSFDTDEVLTTQEEPYVDRDGSGTYDTDESFEDWNENGVWDLGLPITLTLPGGDFTPRTGEAAGTALRVRRLPGGIDANGDASPDAYEPWNDAPRYPEPFDDVNGNWLHDVREPYLDLNGNGRHDDFEPHQEIDGGGVWSASTEPLEDQNGNGRFDGDRPAERFTDRNGNGRWDPAEPFWDRDGDGVWTPPTAPRSPWVPWDPAQYGNAAATALYVASYGEPFADLNGDGRRDDAEPLIDRNANGVWDGGFQRGEMWYRAEFEAATERTTLSLYGTPLEAPALPDLRGLHPDWRLYDLDYVPCPTPVEPEAADRFGRDLYTPGLFPKNTARWRIEVPPGTLRRALASAPGLDDGDAQDQLLVVETRFGTDPETGRLWPSRNQPTNRSTTYCYVHAETSTIPFSERYQFLGDPRHSPYADCDARGTAFPNGYNWFFDDFKQAIDARPFWPAFDPARLADGWLGRSAADVPRFLAWVRAALTQSEALYTHLPGFGFRYLSMGGDVGHAPGSERAATPMDGGPFGLIGAVEENTFVSAGTPSIRGCRKLVCDGAGVDAPLRSGGTWWSKPWLGELWPDAAYESQWAPWGNLRAGRAGPSPTYRQVKRDEVCASQQPQGTRLATAHGELGDEGCTSFFNIGTKRKNTFHHKADVKNGLLLGDGTEMGSAYGLALPTAAPILYPWKLDWDGDGDVGPEFDFTADYPRFSATLGPRYVAKDGKADKEQGSAVVRLLDPESLRAARVLVQSVDLALVAGEESVMRYGVISLLHSLLLEGLPATPQRVRHVPQVQLLTPNSTTLLRRPAAIDLTWRTRWTRWDGRPYTGSHPADFAEPVEELVYVLTYSADGGKTWIHMGDGSFADPDALPLLDGVPDPARTLTDRNPGGDERFTWTTPAAVFPEGTYNVRITAFRRSEQRHHAFHEELIYVSR